MFEISIRKKIIIFFSIVILSVLSLSIYILNNAFGYLNIYEEDLIKTSLIQTLSNHIKNNSMAFENVIKKYNPENIEIFEATIPPMWESWRNVKNRVSSSQNTFFQIEAIKYGMLAYIKSTTQSITYIKNDREIFSSQSLRARRIEGYVEKYLDLLIQIKLEESSILHENQKETVAKIRTISFYAIAIIGIISLLFGNFFSITLTKPIIDLVNNSRLMSQGNLNVKTITTRSNDEIGILADSFNDMSKNINKMVESLKDKAKIEKQHFEDEVKLIAMGKSLKEAQFLSLQSQINPHFLFNTLNTISRTSMFEQAPKTVRLIECLSNIFRYNLRNQDKFITLKEELDILEEYMYIQKTRYGNRINFKINSDVDGSNIRIPVFTLQPLVENAVKHGIEPKEDGGEIIININKFNGWIQIEIKDSGIGFNMENNKHYSSHKSTSIGLNNVQKRLSLKFDGQEQFKIESKIDYGTTITIKIPEINYV